MALSLLTGGGPRKREAIAKQRRTILEFTRKREHVQRWLAQHTVTHKSERIHTTSNSPPGSPDSTATPPREVTDTDLCYTHTHEGMRMGPEAAYSGFPTLTAVQCACKCGDTVILTHILECEENAADAERQKAKEQEEAKRAPKSPGNASGGLLSPLSMFSRSPVRSFGGSNSSGPGSFLRRMSSVGSRNSTSSPPRPSASAAAPLSSLSPLSPLSPQRRESNASAASSATTETDVSTARGDGPTLPTTRGNREETEGSSELRGPLPTTSVLRAPNDYGDTPLHTACRYGHLQAAQWLVQHGAHRDVHTRNSRQQTPLFIACMCGHTRIYAYLRTIVVQLRTFENIFVDRRVEDTSSRPTYPRSLLNADPPVAAGADANQLPLMQQLEEPPVRTLLPEVPEAPEVREFPRVITATTPSLESAPVTPPGDDPTTTTAIPRLLDAEGAEELSMNINALTFGELTALAEHLDVDVHTLTAPPEDPRAEIDMGTLPATVTEAGPDDYVASLMSALQRYRSDSQSLLQSGRETKALESRHAEPIAEEQSAEDDTSTLGLQTIATRDPQDDDGSTLVSGGTASSTVHPSLIPNQHGPSSSVKQRVERTVVKPYTRSRGRESRRIDIDVSEWSYERMFEVFSAHDADMSGTLDGFELSAVFDDILGYRPHADVVRHLLHRYAKSDGRQLQLIEFVKLMRDGTLGRAETSASDTDHDSAGSGVTDEHYDVQVLAYDVPFRLEGVVAGAREGGGGGEPEPFALIKRIEDPRLESIMFLGDTLREVNGVPLKPKEATVPGFSLEHHRLPIVLTFKREFRGPSIHGIDWMPPDDGKL